MDTKGTRFSGLVPCGSASASKVSLTACTFLIPRALRVQQLGPAFGPRARVFIESIPLGRRVDTHSEQAFRFEFVPYEDGDVM
jgi:hypothetical protein